MSLFIGQKEHSGKNKSLSHELFVYIRPASIGFRYITNS